MCKDKANWVRAVQHNPKRLTPFYAHGGKAAGETSFWNHPATWQLRDCLIITANSKLSNLSTKNYSRNWVFTPEVGTDTHQCRRHKAAAYIVIFWPLHPQDRMLWDVLDTSAFFFPWHLVANGTAPPVQTRSLAQPYAPVLSFKISSKSGNCKRIWF